MTTDTVAQEVSTMTLQELDREILTIKTTIDTTLRNTMLFMQAEGVDFSMCRQMRAMSESQLSPMRARLALLEKLRPTSVLKRAATKAPTIESESSDDDDDNLCPPPPDRNIAANNRADRVAARAAARAVEGPSVRDAARKERNKVDKRRSASVRHDSAAALGQIAVQNVAKRPKRKAAVTKQGLRVSNTEFVSKDLTKEMFFEQRSEKPIWDLANTGLSEGWRYSEPPSEMGLLSLPISGNMSRFMRGDPRQIMVAAIIMELSTRRPKMAHKFGYDQIPKEYGGGPFYVASRMFAEYPESMREHLELIVKGHTQISKTPDQAFACWVMWFAIGILPVMFIRNRGGGVVGTADAAEGIQNINSEVKATWLSIKDRYPQCKAFNVMDLMITPVCTSRGGCLTMKCSGSYLLAYPQCLVSCTNMTQLSMFTSTPETGASRKRYASNNHPNMPLFLIFSGARREKDDLDANPYLPYTHDPEQLGSNNGKYRILTAIGADFDEDDQNRSSTGNEAKDTVLFKNFAGSTEQIADLQRVDVASDAGPDVDGSDEDSDQHEFYGKFNGMRGHFAMVAAFTATPTTDVYKISTSNTSYNEIKSHVIEIIPSRNYIGFATPRFVEAFPYCTKHIEIRSLPDRNVSVNIAMKDAYPHALSQLGYDVDRDGYPEPFRVDSRGVVKVPKASLEKVLSTPSGKAVKACDVQEGVRNSTKVCRVKGDSFWWADGNNITAVLEDVEVCRDEYVRWGYRNILLLSNFTKNNNQIESWISTILGHRGEDIPDGARCSGADLIKDLIVMGWTHLGISFNWVKGEVDEQLFQRAIDSLLDSDNLPGTPVDVVMAQEFAKGCRWGIEGDDEQNPDDPLSSRGISVRTHVSDINLAYSVMSEYLRFLREADPSAFIKMLPIAGGIGERGARYKSKSHEFILSDMLFSFDVSSTKQMTMHCASAIQAVGRLCGMVVDVDDCPPVILWTPAACRVHIENWQNCMDEIPTLSRIRLPEETNEGLLRRIVVSEDGLGCPSLRIHFSAITGQSAKGKKFFSRIDHQLRKADAVGNEMHSIAEAADMVPETLPVVDNSDVLRTKYANACTRIGMARMEQALNADEEDYDSGAEGGLRAVLGAPAMDGFRSVPVPIRRKIIIPKSRTKEEKKDAKRDEHGYDVDSKDNTNAISAVCDLLRLREQYPPTSDLDSVPMEAYMQMFVARYIYYLRMPHANQGKPHSQATGDYRHGLKSFNTRNNYQASVQKLLTPTASKYFRNFSDLPSVADSVKTRMQMLTRIGGLFKETHPDVEGDIYNYHEPIGHYVGDMNSHLKKWSDLFPPMGMLGMKHFLINSPVPSKSQPAPRNSYTETEPSCMEVYYDDESSSDEDDL